MSRKRRRRLIEMSVVQVSPYLRAEKPLLWLRQKDAMPTVLLPIAVGEFEAAALQMGLGHAKPLRPISYDLLATMLDRLDVRTRRVIIHSVKDFVFLATVTIEQGARLREVDARPSDAVALALRTGAPIFVSHELLDVAGLSGESGGTVEDAMRRFYDLEPQVVDASPSPIATMDAPLSVDEKTLPAEETPVVTTDNQIGSGEIERPASVAVGGEPTLHQLRNRLQQAVLCEEYEEAAELRDEIQRLIDEANP